MQVPILSRRRERRESQLAATIEHAVDKALAPALAGAPGTTGVSGATYPVPNPSSPFSQTGGSYGANPLPRPNDAFGSLFGPGYPLFPDALDPLGSSGRAEPRRWQYPVTYNIQLLDREVPWTMLRQIASQVDVVNRCIELVQDSCVGMEWSFGFSPQIINQIMTENDETNSAKATAIAREKYGDELTRVQAFFEHPDKRMGQTFSQWLTQMVWAHLVYDGIAVYPQYTLGGELHSLSLIDTSTIKVLLDNQGFVPQPPSPAYQQILYGFPRGEFQAEDVDADGKIPNGYRSDQLAYYIRRPRLHTVYGYSTVEECINMATIYMERQRWLHAEWSHGVTPKLLLTSDGNEGWSPEQRASYEQIMNDRLTGQIQRRQQLFLLPPGMQATQMQQLDQTYKSDYDEWLVLQIGAKFGVPQSQLGIQMRSSIGGAGQTKGQTDQSDKFATDALVNFLIDCVNDLARRFMGMGPEITMTVTGGGDSDDDTARATADASDVGAGIRTRNEIRAERGIPLMNEPEADQLAITTGTGVSFLSGQLAAQESGQQMAASGQVPGKPAEEQPNGDQRQSVPVSKPNNAATSNDDNFTVESGKPSGTSSPKSASGTNITPKDDPRQPDTDAEKELAAFAKFVAKRLPTGKWRDFDFRHQGPVRASELNKAARSGDQEFITSLLAKRDDTPSKAEDTERLNHYWADSPEGRAKIGWGTDGDWARCMVEVGKYIPDVEEAKGHCANLHHRATGAWPGHAPGESKSGTGKKGVATPIAAGIAVRAANSGRVLMLQRSMNDADDPAAGDWEFPGGCLEDDESPYDAAVREWQEETGIQLPQGQVVGDWLSHNGVYQGFVYEVPSESDVLINTDTDDRQVLNPDDPDGDNIETVAWWDTSDLPGNPALRSEMLLTPWNVINNTAAKASVDEAIIDYSGRVILPKPLKVGDKVIVEHQGKKKNDEYEIADDQDADVNELGKKASAQATGPRSAITALGERLHDEVTEFYAPKIADIMQQVTGIEAAITGAKKTLGQKNA